MFLGFTHLVTRSLPPSKQNSIVTANSAITAKGSLSSSYVKSACRISKKKNNPNESVVLFFYEAT